MRGKFHTANLLAAALFLLATGCDGLITSLGAPDDEPGQPGVVDGPADVVAESPDDPDAPNAPDAGVDEPAMVTISPTESTEDMLNPERGFYVGVNLLSPGGAAGVRGDGHSLAIALVHLDDYRDRPLDATLLAELDDGLDAVRAAGIKVVLRFNYNSSFTDDAPKDVVLGHIAQLEPLLQANADVIAVLQAGFIGAWGEWHSSTNGLDDDAARAEILTALLDALPASRNVQIRTPMYKAAIFPGGPISAAEAYSETDRARTGHHNDCFLASDSDFGTYASPVADWKAYVASDARYTAMGGETCAVYEPRTSCAAATAELAALHWSYLNREYNTAVIDGWVADGCDEQIRERLGYRFVVERVAYSEEVAPGGVLDVEIDVANRGFAAPYNERPVYVAVTGQGRRWTARLTGVDARRWAAGETTTVATQLRIPADAPQGLYEVSLWLPDAAETLADDARYSIQLANEGVWDDAAGDNVLISELPIDADAPGATDPLATDLVEL